MTLEALRADVAIIGGGLGACAAALAAARLGYRVVLTEETHWVGGQLTNQAVPPDEHPWIEEFGATASYRTLRREIRNYYRAHLPLTAQARADARLNPGNGWVSRLCHDPRVAVTPAPDVQLLYWLQTRAPGPDGGAGYPGLRLRGDVVGGTPDGLAPAPYVRESRRIRAEFTVLEQHIAHPLRPDGPELFSDSVGVGCYRIDLHPRVSGAGYLDLGCWPFQIPLGAMIPVRVENLLPGGKNLGVTHVANGAFRLHPVEWNVGEAAGILAAFCLERKLLPRTVRHRPELIEPFQALLRREGVELSWPRLTPM
jgi:FAD dependent oxidoreductase/NAD(P)-binding Rossmann-like domain